MRTIHRASVWALGLHAALGCASAPRAPSTMGTATGAGSGGAPAGTSATAAAVAALPNDVPTDVVFRARVTPDFVFALGEYVRAPDNRSPVTPRVPVLRDGDRILSTSQAGVDPSRPLEVVWRSRSRALDATVDSLQTAALALTVPPPENGADTESRIRMLETYGGRDDVHAFEARVRRECPAGAMSERWRWPAADAARLAQVLTETAISGLRGTRDRVSPAGFDAIVTRTGTPIMVGVWHTNDAVIVDTVSEPFGRCPAAAGGEAGSLARLRAELIRSRETDQREAPAQRLEGDERLHITANPSGLARWTFTLGMIETRAAIAFDGGEGPTLGPAARAGLLAIGLREAASSHSLVEVPRGVRAAGLDWSLRGSLEHPVIEVDTAFDRWAPSVADAAIRVPAGHRLLVDARPARAWGLPTWFGPEEVPALRIPEHVALSGMLGALTGSAHLLWSTALLASIAPWGTGFAPILAVPGLEGVRTFRSPTAATGENISSRTPDVVALWFDGARPEAEIACAMRSGRVPCEGVALRRDAVVSIGRVSARMSRVSDHWVVVFAIRAADARSFRPVFEPDTASANATAAPSTEPTIADAMLALPTGDPPARPGPDALARMLRMITPATFRLTIRRHDGTRARARLETASP